MIVENVELSKGYCKHGSFLKENDDYAIFKVINDLNKVHDHNVIVWIDAKFILVLRVFTVGGQGP